MTVKQQRHQVFANPPYPSFKKGGDNVATLVQVNLVVARAD